MVFKKSRGNIFSLPLNILLCFIFIIVCLKVVCSQDAKKESKESKYILVCVFPGGKSHNFVLKELFDYSLKHSEEFEYHYHILVHNWDREAWPVRSDYKILSYGDTLIYDKVFNDALDLVRTDPIWGYSKFHKAMMHIYHEFMNSKLLDELRKVQYDTMITDIPNFLTRFLKPELKIPNHIYLSPPSLPYLFYGMFEINPSYYPTMGAKFTDEMTFPERFLNSLFILGSRAMFWMYMGEQADVFKEYGYDIGSNDIFLHDSLVMVQYTTGFFYNLSLPPNFIRLNAITPRPANPIANSDKNIDTFLNKHKKNIYFSQGTIVKIVDFDKIMPIFQHFKDYGFILSFKKQFLDQSVIKFPENVLVVGWVAQNDLLGDSRIHAFITHGGNNSVTESIYHCKPMVVLGVTLDQINTASVVKKRQVGIVVHDLADIQAKTLIQAVDSLLQPEEKNVYLQNVKKYGKLIKANKDPREEYKYWLDYGFNFGYSHLMVKAYTEYNYFQLYNYDILLLWVLIFYTIYWSIKRVLICLFCSCKAPKKKEKKEKKVN